MRNILLIILLFAGMINSKAQTYDQDFVGKVVKVTDGNTFEIEDDNNEIFVLMLSEVDCPELGQLQGNEAKEFTEDLILKKKVAVELKGKDWLGNKLAVITLKNGSILHDELLKNGLGWASKKASDSSTLLQTNAQQSKVGIWVEVEPTPPWVYRRQQTMMQAKSR